MKLGILDWGIGGVGFYALIRARYPDVPVVYWSDAGTVPYGRQPPVALAERIGAVARWMKVEAGVTHLAVACNAASSVLPLIDRADGAFPQITGVIDHGVRAAMRRSDTGQVIGIVGGRRTILSGAYRRGLSDRDVRQRIAQPLSARIEAGDLGSSALQGELDRIMRPLRRIDLLVLACTHYPAIGAAFSARAPYAVIVDPAAEMLDWASERWPLAAANRAGDPDQVLTTGDEGAMARSARLAFGMEIAPVAVRL